MGPKSKVSVDHEGPCEDNNCKDCNDFVGPAYNEPVCGDDGKTYRNKCELERENCLNKKTVSFKHQGECCESQCPSIRSPFCATDGKTYGNSCELKIENCKRKRDGKYKGILGFVQGNYSKTSRASDNWAIRCQGILRGWILFKQRRGRVRKMLLWEWLLLGQVRLGGAPGELSPSNDTVEATQ